MSAVLSSQTYFRPAALILLLIVEVMGISFGFDSYQAGILNSGQWFGFLAYGGQFAKLLVAVLVFLLLGLWPRLPRHIVAIERSLDEHPQNFLLIAQLCSFGLFLWCTSAVFGTSSNIQEPGTGLIIAWCVAFIATGLLWLIALAPWRFWRTLVHEETTVVAAALAVGLLAWLLATFAQSLWTPLSDLTFWLSAGILGLGYPDIVLNAETKMLGAGDFVVNIAPQCSGYEGMGLMAIFTGFYLSMFRHEFRFPHALLLFPIGIATIWVFNNFRIAALIAIGASWSPEVAIGGFHSQAGWISFIVVIVLMLLLAYRMPFFSTVPQAPATRGASLTLPMALLIPFIALLAATMLTSAMTADFDWLYPLRVIAVGLALAVCWQMYGLRRLAFRLEPWLAGIIVFAIWLLLVPVDPEANNGFEAALSGQSAAFVTFWILFRFVGSVITVPLAEELLFRGYLLGRLARQGIVLEGRIAFSWVGLIGSSVLFGLLHANWLAGIVAGLVFGCVRYRSDSIRDAIVAHACTNLLLSIYVVASGNWSLW